uniref:Cytokinin riboside 5'-monophosphate phosphoribohydrolase n=1 Tax=Candidatus Kentrum sp. DK TaxID=2126562 RepID=A0A450SJR0_9GAMM|nr:MAG: hypothetical protein BECKDK2373B_GA0170837_104330 [Candidatus Kentron sp. DK]VFJ57718.1 MAG: hypothetical protein BECKDK2373C_GA0170839_10613 [Candidatus Kentron sp. DK]
MKNDAIRRLCIFCGARPGHDPAFGSALLALADILLERDITVVYGGGSIGLMGALADHMARNNGRIIGVIPKDLEERELLHRDLTETYVVDSMHARKQKMHELSDGFVLAPGGFGSLEEFFEALTWNQLGLHAKPCGILNTKGFYDHLLLFLDNALASGFLSDEDYRRVRVASVPGELMRVM